VIKLNKETVLHNVTMSASKAFIDSNMSEYIGSRDGYNLLVSDLTARYIEAYKQAEKEYSEYVTEYSKSETKFSNKPFIKNI
jgi:hypothetical protein